MTVHLHCRFMDMEQFAMEAEAKAALVMVALQGGRQADGGVQKFLEFYNIPFTGPSWLSALLSSNQVRLLAWSYKRGCARRSLG